MVAQEVAMNKQGHGKRNGKHKISRRDMMILYEHLRGRTYTAIGERYGITGVRALQISHRLCDLIADSRTPSVRHT